MKIFIAEKPSLAKKIAEGLGGGTKADGYIKGSDWCVTWCFGHLYEMMNPEGYNPDFKAWKMADLPIIPDTFLLEPKPDAKAQIKVIKNLLKQASIVTSAGDPDREGSLLVDDVLKQLKWAGETLRIWLTDLTPAGVKHALNNLAPYSQYQGYIDSADARRKSDWLVGINLTRGATIRAREQGLDGVYSVGRVQTPTLNLVVTRDRQIANFKPVNYFTVQAQFAAKNGTYPGIWLVPESIADAEGRCLNPKTALALCAKVQGKQGVIEKTITEKKKESAPLPFSLAALQAFTSEKWGMTAQDTLDIAQSLYEKHQATTYPRTDCGYLEENKLGEVTATMAALSGIDDSFSKAASGANQSAKPRCFNDKKTTAHTGIIPTAKTPNFSAFSDAEKKVYTAIAHRYIAQFYPAFEYSKTEIITRCEGQLFKTTGKTPLVQGWKALLRPPKTEKEGEDNITLPAVEKAENVACNAANKVDKQTNKPSHFTEGTLITAMANVARFVEDSEYKKYLRENDGLGTEATRAGIIEVLKGRGFLATKGKKIVSTPAGGALIDALPEDITDPVMTALWEQALSDIAVGKLPPEAFIQKQTGWLKNRIESLQTLTIKNTGPTHKCPKCKQGILRKRKGSNGAFWACNCYPDCNATYPDKGGKPNTTAKPKAPVKVSTEHKCTACGSGLIKRSGKKAGSAFWGCSGFPKCKESYQDNKGKPVFQ